MYRCALAVVLSIFPAVGALGADCVQVPLKRQVEVAATIRETVTTYFAHWDPERADAFSLAFDGYVGKVAGKRCRNDFVFDSMKVIASLRNGHSDFADAQLWAASPGRTGLLVVYRDGRWIVANSQRAEVQPGKEIVSLDGEPIEQVYARLGPYIATSSDIARRDRLFAMAPLFPRRFVLGFSDGSQAMIDRKAATSAWHAPAPLALPEGVHLHAITSFEDPSHEQQALAFVSGHADAKALVFDLRGNPGGITPVRLMSALIERPYVSWGEMSAMSVGLLKAYGELSSLARTLGDDAFAGMTQGMQDYFSQPLFYAPGKRVLPADNPYRMPVYLLVDRRCASACEDFVYAMKASQRAVIVGEPTHGSSGQPMLVDLGDGMTLRVGAKRMVFADGSTFEGVGVLPDIAVSPSAADFAAEGNPMLEQALAHLAGQAGSGQ